MMMIRYMRRMSAAMTMAILTFCCWSDVVNSCGWCVYLKPLMTTKAGTEGCRNRVLAFLSRISDGKANPNLSCNDKFNALAKKKADEVLSSIELITACANAKNESAVNTSLDVRRLVFKCVVKMIEDLCKSEGCTFEFTRESKECLKDLEKMLVSQSFFDSIKNFFQNHKVMLLLSGGAVTLSLIAAIFSWTKTRTSLLGFLVERSGLSKSVDFVKKVFVEEIIKMFKHIKETFGGEIVKTGECARGYLGDLKGVAAGHLEEEIVKTGGHARDCLSHLKDVAAEHLGEIGRKGEGALCEAIRGVGEEITNSAKRNIDRIGNSAEGRLLEGISGIEEYLKSLADRKATSLTEGVRDLGRVFSGKIESMSGRDIFAVIACNVIRGLLGWSESTPTHDYGSGGWRSWLRGSSGSVASSPINSHADPLSYSDSDSEGGGGDQISSRVESAGPRPLLSYAYSSMQHAYNLCSDLITSRPVRSCILYPAQQLCRACVRFSRFFS